MDKNPFKDSNGKILPGKLVESWEFEQEAYEKRLAAMPKDEADKLRQQKAAVGRRQQSEVSVS